MKKLFLLYAVCLFGCENSNQITITKVEGSMAYENAKLSVKESLITEEGHLFSFDIENYELGVKSPKLFDYQLANSAKGQHIHSRSYHESVKNKNAFFLTQSGGEVADKKDLSKELLFYSRPKGVYKGADTERVLLDFYLVNTSLSPNGNKVRVTIQDTKFLIDEWAPYYIEGLPKGEISITLELIDSKGDLIDSPFNPSERMVRLED